MVRGSALAAVALFALFAAAAGCSRNDPSPAPPAIAGEQSDAHKPAPHSKHTVTVKFDYDFRRTPSCSRKIRQQCVQQFVAYDISAGNAHRVRLFTIPLPRQTKGFVTGITATSPPLDWESGKHLLSVVSQFPDGAESQTRACTTWINIP